MEIGRLSSKPRNTDINTMWNGQERVCVKGHQALPVVRLLLIFGLTSEYYINKFYVLLPE